jgi:hypothetical protein
MKRAAFLVVAVGLSLAADEVKNESLDKEYARFEGSWQVVSLEIGGMKMPEKSLKDTRLIIKGKEFTMKDKAVGVGQPEDGFVASAKAGKGKVIALGQSLWWHWISEQQDAGTDNAKLLRLLLVAGKLSEL